MEEKEKIINTETPAAAETVDTIEVIEAQAPDTACEIKESEHVAATDGAQAPKTAEAEEKQSADAPDQNHCPPKEKGFKAWWARHKPTKRRLIQIYSLLLYNAYIKGFIKGEIFTGLTKTACVPGLNCYSCPGAVAACPLGALQNALTGTGHGGAYYVLGILLLYGLIFGRTICGFLCPMGLGQDLLYKIRTPKLKKSRVTRILSYLKYVILAVLVIGIPIIYAIDKTAVPGFCKYICPAGTLEGAFMLLLHPDNDSLYRMLGVLFSWKTVVLVCVFTASIFIYRFFCRFLCPLGAIYGLFNKFALLGIKVNRDKCTHCGKCLNKCKMDIKHVGDHECINCGECISVC
ncbi:MAG: 4Fe-4S binding protein, partial [Clostridiales bacterium]|nr:4Fe-4S binding protein [Clostridiales bacterium]